MNQIRSIGLLAAFVVLLNLFLFTVNGPVSVFLVLIGLLVLILGSRGLINRLVAPGTFIILVLAVSILKSGNPFIQVVATLGALVILCLFNFLLSEGKSFFNDLGDLLLSPLNLSLSYINSAFKLPFSSKPKTVVSFLVGLGIGLPIFFIITGLLSSADPVFNHFVVNYFNQQIIVRIVFSLVVFAVMLPFVLLKIVQLPEKLLPKKFPFPLPTIVVLALVIISLGLYLIVDWPYIFVNVAAETSLSQFGVATYSEYVRRGFIEFLLVAAIVYAILWLGLLVFRSVEKGSRSTILALQLFLTGELALYCLSIFRRIYLYQSLHGWSLVRIYGGLFLLWISALIAILVFRHFEKRSLVVAETVITLAFLLFVCLFNAEAFIVTTHPPTVNGNVDYIYLSSMTPDGVTGWIKSYGYAVSVINRPNFSDPKHLITRDERRQVAAAGYSLQNLLINYHHLVISQSGPTAQKDYLRLVALQTGAKKELTFKNVIVGQAWYVTHFDLDSNPPTSFYLISNADIYRGPDSSLNHILVWNYSEQQAFKLMNEKIGFSHLLDLDRRYFVLYKKITSQPIGERDYDLDTSLSNPLL